MNKHEGSLLRPGLRSVVTRGGSTGNSTVPAQRERSGPESAGSVGAFSGTVTLRDTFIQVFRVPPLSYLCIQCKAKASLLSLA